MGAEAGRMRGKKESKIIVAGRLVIPKHQEIQGKTRTADHKEASKCPMLLISTFPVL